MSIPTIGEQRFQAQLIHSLNEIAEAIQENTKAVRAYTEVLQSTTKAPDPDEVPVEDDDFPIPRGPLAPL